MSKNNSKDLMEDLRRVTLEIITHHSRPKKLELHGATYQTIYPSVGVRLIEQELRRQGYAKQYCTMALESLRDWKVVTLTGPARSAQVRLS